METLLPSSEFVSNAATFLVDTVWIATAFTVMGLISHAVNTKLRPTQQFVMDKRLELSAGPKVAIKPSMVPYHVKDVAPSRGAIRYGRAAVNEQIELYAYYEAIAADAQSRDMYRLTRHVLTQMVNEGGAFDEALLRFDTRMEQRFHWTVTPAEHVTRFRPPIPRFIGVNAA